MIQENSYQLVDISQQDNNRAQIETAIKSFNENSMQSYNKLKLAHKFIKSWGIEKFIINQRQQNCMILEMIKGIKFTHLKNINIKYNNIENIDLLVDINMPNLQALEIDDNRIASFRPLRRMPQKLTKLTISNNLANELAFLSEANFQLKQFGLEYLPDCLMVQSLAFLVKLPQSKIQTIRALNSTRITQKSINCAIINKFNGVDLRTYSIVKGK